MPFSRSKCNPLRLFRSKSKQKKTNSVADQGSTASTNHALSSDLEEKDTEEGPGAGESDDLLAIAHQKLLQDKETGPILKKATIILSESGLHVGANGVLDLQQLHKSLDKKVNELQEKEWEISIDGHYINVKEKLYRAMKNILVLKDVITTAASACPPAAIACAGVTVSLMLIIRAHDQNDSLLTGLEKTSDLLPRLYLTERLYMKPNTNLSGDFVSKFKAGLVSLYSKILEFQARALCYLSEFWLIQLSSNILNQNQWDVLTKSISDQETEAQKFTSLMEVEERRADMGVLKDTISSDFEARFKKFQGAQASSARIKQVNKLLESLHTCPYRDRKNRVSDRVPGTCEWFTSHPLFQTWDKGDDSRLLWLSADPGCGKSVLSKFLVDEVLQRFQKRTVCYFFFRDDFPDQKRSSIALASILRQLFIAYPHLLSDKVLHQFAAGGETLLQSFIDLWEILVSATASVECDEIVFVIDALDECAEEDRYQLIGAVRDLSSKSSNNTSGFKFFLTSRPYGSIHERFRQLEVAVPTIHLKGEANAEVEKIAGEIALVIQQRAHEIAIQKLLEEDEEKFLREKLTEAKNRTYLWVALTLNYIESLDGFTKGRVRETINDKIPQTVNEAYGKILNKSKDPAKAKRLLHIIMAAKRPLSVEELSLALAVDKKIKSSESFRENVEPPQRFRSTLRDMCGLILVVVDDKVYPLHQTVKEFLVPGTSDNLPSDSLNSEYPSKWRNSLSPAQSNKVLAETLTWYLDCDCTEIGLDILLDYATSFWHHHFRDAFPCDENDMSTMGCRICAPNSEFQTRFFGEKAGLDFPQNPDTLMAASSLGLESVVRQLLSNESIEVDSKDSMDRTPLYWAASQGYDAIIKLLLETNKLDPDSKDSRGQTPLHGASWNGYESTAKLLLETNKVDPDSKDSRGQTPLLGAAWNGYESTVKLLLETNKVDPDPKDSRGRTPFHGAAWNGHTSTVKLLLETDKVDPDSKSSVGSTPLHGAARNRHESITKLLLDTNKVDPDLKDSVGQTPLYRAAEDGYDAVVKLLLNTGKVDIEARASESGLTAYEVAEQHGRLSTMALLERYMTAGQTVI
ncbi:uncharacterized protein N7506_003412 [Penicillium brevicompactum]|uniref:NACHT domain-containing protein n=1 Tax=Penicillium brevicompactum TaxID=5074 RepID=A0A9W9QTW8_PENBR|nr:uncharacterized protein N7506_003412 [Penicillium brevicompactum]KAJ5343588.1 hypothetical protein N7506_003412 [Penicillium brevicompactum]KAJ5345621.1 hypothetical protein N7452_003625 [Penicillium brevicompactum]